METIKSGKVKILQDTNQIEKPVKTELTKEQLVLNGQQKAQDFITAYKKLCDEHGYQIVVSPAYKSRDDGTFSTVLQTSVGKLIKRDK